MVRFLVAAVWSDQLAGRHQGAPSTPDALADDLAEVIVLGLASHP